MRLLVESALQGSGFWCCCVWAGLRCVTVQLLTESVGLGVHIVSLPVHQVACKLTKSRALHTHSHPGKLGRGWCIPDHKRVTHCIDCAVCCCMQPCFSSPCASVRCGCRQHVAAFGKRQVAAASSCANCCPATGPARVGCHAAGNPQQQKRLPFSCQRRHCLYGSWLHGLLPLGFSPGQQRR